MKWKKFKIKTITDAEDIIISTLYDIGLEGAQIEDNVPLTALEKEQMFVDILPQMQEDDGTAYLSFFVEETEDGKLLRNGEETDAQTILEEVREELDGLRSFMEIGEGSIEVDETEDIDWINNWKVFFKPFRLDDNIVIKPTWETLSDKKDDDIVIEIDPGTAFGSGSHETTKLCISQLKKYIKKDTELLDVGTGSGILSIIGLKLGAHHAMATDIDPNAIRATNENFAINEVSEQAEVQQVNILDKEEADSFYEKNNGKKYDVIVANILADVIIPLSGIVAPLLKDDGVFITSGIINTMEEAVKEAMLANHFEILEINHMKDWVSITAKKA